MRILFDNGTPRGVAAALSHHAVEEAGLVAGTLCEMASCRLPTIAAAVDAATPGSLTEVEIPID